MDDLPAACNSSNRRSSSAVQTLFLFRSMAVIGRLKNEILDGHQWFRSSGREVRPLRRWQRTADAERWSEDISEEVAHELRRRCDLQMRDVPFFLQDFTDRYEGRYRDVQLPLPLRLV
jgi:hypothetical protein